MELGQNERQRRRALFEGGLKIVTTLDPKWQAAAQQAASLPWAVHPAYPNTQEPEVSIVSVDNASGAIRTMLSGRDYARDAKDFVTTGHQPGSSYKPYILAAAFEEGIPPTQVYDSTSPARFPGVNADGSTWVVDNAEGAGSHGLMDLYTATTHSVNVVFARLIMDVDPTNVDDVTEKMTDLTRTKNGDRDIPGFASQATGSVEMSPLEMASGYQTIANDGRHCVPYAIQSIARGDDVVYRHEAKCRQTIEPDIAHLITSMLRSVVTSGTAASALAGFGPWVVAGKTGTAQLNTNVWFVGYSAQVSTSVWVGYPGDPEPLQNYFGTSVFGGTVAAPIWRAYMGRILGGLPVRTFPAPPAPQMAPLPNVVGLPKDEAIRTLADAGFRAEVTMVDALAPKGEIVSQNPAGGQAAVGTLVRLEASTGIPPTIAVPDVVGLRPGKAAQTLEDAGFVVAIVEQETVVPDEVGRVLHQLPRAGRKWPAGTTVTITVGVAPP
jgi:penicillin-binding protein 1A